MFSHFVRRCGCLGLLALSAAAFVLASGKEAAAQCTNYTITQSTGSIVPGTTNINNNNDDFTVAVPLPFPVNYYGTSYTTIYVCTNGWASFSSTAGTGYVNDICLPG